MNRQPELFEHEEAGLVRDLKALAVSRLPAGKCYVEETSNPMLWHSSRVSWDTGADKPLRMEVYYHSFEYCLPVLAHEVGHLMTLAQEGGVTFYASSDVHRYIAEELASKWAVEWLAGKVPAVRLRWIIGLLQRCLDNYRPPYVRRAVLKEVKP